MSIAPRRTPCIHCGHDPRRDFARGGMESVKLLRDLSDAIAAIAKHGFDKDTTKDPEAFLRWRMLNDAQAAAIAYLNLFGDKASTTQERK